MSAIARRWDRRSAVEMAGVSVVAVAAVAMRLAAGAWPVDDAFITFRYSRNLLAGIGLVYNAGERVLGTSTPLYAVLLALVSKVTLLEIPRAALVLNAGADAAVVVLLWRIGREIGIRSWLRCSLALAWTLYPIGLRYSLGGMECSLAAALLLGGVLAYVLERATVAALLLALAALVRPDVAVFGAAMLADLAWRRRAVPWPELLVFGGLLASWAGLSMAVYGSPIPQSLFAKSHHIYFIPYGRNLEQIGYQLLGLAWNDVALAARGLQTFRPTPPTVAESVVLAAVIAVCAIGMQSPRDHAARMKPVSWGVMVTLCVFSAAALRGVVMAEWYLIALTPLALLYLFNGIETLARAAPGRYVLTSWLGALWIVGVQLAGLNLTGVEQRSLWTPRAVWVEREGLYRNAALMLRPLLKADDLVAAPEIGSLGYYCDCHILDTVGLVSPAATRFAPYDNSATGTNYAIPPDLVRATHPDYLVTLDAFAGQSLLVEDWFNREYQPIWRQPTSAFGSRELLVFRRIVQADR